VQQSSKAGLFIDGAHLYASAKSIGLDLDYKRLLGLFDAHATLVRAQFYIAIAEDDVNSGVRPLANWLDYNGYTVITKAAAPFTDATGRRKIKGSLAVKLTVDALELSPYIDHAVLVAGDAEFAPLVRALQRRGKYVTIVSTLVSAPAMITDDLRRLADQFIDLADLQARLSRNPLDREIKRARA